MRALDVCFVYIIFPHSSVKLHNKCMKHNFFSFFYITLFHVKVSLLSYSFSLSTQFLMCMISLFFFFINSVANYKIAFRPYKKISTELSLHLKTGKDDNDVLINFVVPQQLRPYDTEKRVARNIVEEANHVSLSTVTRNTYIVCGVNLDH